MPKIFICYRREDSQWPAQLIYNNLVDHFGPESIVFDIDTIPLGVDFREYLNMEVSKCDVLLAVIGDQWLEILKQRWDQPNDYVRIELHAALQRKIPVVPVLVGRQPVPSETELPPELASLSYRQAAEVRVGLDLQAHLKRLIDRFDRLFSEREVGKELKQKQVNNELGRELTPKKYTNSIGMEFVLIPAGRFEMGGGEAEWFLRLEHPRHVVWIEQPFYLQSMEVTLGEWRRFTEETGYKTEAETGGGAFVLSGSMWEMKKDTHWDNPLFHQDDRHPVTCVSWNDILAFIHWLNRVDDESAYRLPTEAEWEYATRAGTTTIFSFGDEDRKLGEYAWFIFNSGSQTHPVGSKKPNSWGLYDMHGNVNEWVTDDWHDSYENAPADGRAWINDPRGLDRVLRGGSWSSDARGCRSAARHSTSFDSRKSSIGFRLAKSVFLGS
jgi:formylglycine-generating enzyme required for sulfatase activity